MTVSRMPLGDAVDAALAGEITNAASVAGVLAAAAARADDWRGLRAADAALAHARDDQRHRPQVEPASRTGARGACLSRPPRRRTRLGGEHALLLPA